MADDADRAQRDTEQYEAAIPRNYEIPKGGAGECVECGGHSPRIVNGRCAPCRDLLGLK